MSHTTSSLIQMFHDRVGGSVSKFVLTARQFQWLFDLAYREDGFVPNGPTGRPHVQVVTPDACYYVSQQRNGSAIVTVRV